MSKYPVKYESASKGAVDIEDMATPHIANAWRKLGGASLKSAVAAGEALRLRTCMFNELVARGCSYDDNTDQWTFPEKPVTP